ncbi:MAG: hypothetical protein AAFP98_03365 [Pseudomonadota bacterium]
MSTKLSLQRHISIAWVARVFVFATAFVVASCDALSAPRYLAPFEAQPDDRVLFSHSDLNLNGTVWSFEKNGTVVNFGGPVGLIFNGDAVRVVWADFPGISLETVHNAATVDPALVADLIQAAHRYCEQAFGGQDLRNGASIYADGNSILFVDHCQATRK